ncbi:hypothetical protein EVA_03271 [gut metagenome]|uniref:Uncharacterized protein n=1 Tax=gut metagenome TaxID=749906 RepID=J9GZD7_9ZZZZ
MSIKRTAITVPIFFPPNSIRVTIRASLAKAIDSLIKSSGE